MQDGSFESGVGMTADNQVDVRHIFRQNFVFGLAFVFIGAAVGNAHNHVHIFLGFNVRYGFLCRFRSVPEFQNAGGSAG